MNIPLSQIQPSPRPVRTSWDEAKLNELAASIAEQGVIVPVKVRQNGDGYELVYGHRRVEAARRAGFADVPAVVEGMTDWAALLQQITENEAREDVPYAEKAAGYEAALSHPGNPEPGNAEALARATGVPVTTIKAARLWRREADIGAAVVLGIDADSTGRSEGVLATLEIARAIGDDVPTKRELAAKVGREGLTRQQTRRVAEAVAAAPNDEVRKALLDAPYSPYTHNADAVRDDPDLYQNIKTVAADQSWRDAPEVKAVIDWLNDGLRRLPGWRSSDALGKLAPEHKPYIITRARRLADALYEWADDMEASNE